MHKLHNKVAKVLIRYRVNGNLSESHDELLIAVFKSIDGKKLDLLKCGATFGTKTTGRGSKEMI